jgi:hypothetical protein
VVIAVLWWLVYGGSSARWLWAMDLGYLFIYLFAVVLRLLLFNSLQLWWFGMFFGVGHQLGCGFFGMLPC